MHARRARWWWCYWAYRTWNFLLIAPTHDRLLLAFERHLLDESTRRRKFSRGSYFTCWWKLTDWMIYSLCLYGDEDKKFLLPSYFLPIDFFGIKISYFCHVKIILSDNRVPHSIFYLLFLYYCNKNLFIILNMNFIVKRNTIFLSTTQEKIKLYLFCEKIWKYFSYSSVKKIFTATLLSRFSPIQTTKKTLLNFDKTQDLKQKNS